MKANYFDSVLEDLGLGLSNNVHTVAMSESQDFWLFFSLYLKLIMAHTVALLRYQN